VIFRRWERAKQSLSEELESYLKMAIAERVACGEDLEQARAVALRELGNLPLIEDVTLERWGWLWLENLFRDINYALRRLRHDPAFSVAVLPTLAFGIGANLAVFQLLHSVILADLPVAHPEELVGVRAARTPFDGGIGSPMPRTSVCAHPRPRPRCWPVPVLVGLILSFRTGRWGSRPASSSRTTISLCLA
jgi:hypothetical protein